jgi:hypothetical protein
MTQQVRAIDEIDHPHPIAMGIECGSALHEAVVAADKLKNLSFLVSASGASHLNDAELNPEGFVTYEFQDIFPAVGQCNRTLHPKFGLFIDPESSFFLVAAHEEQLAFQLNDVAAIDVHEVGGVIEDFRPSRKGLTGKEGCLPFDPFFLASGYHVRQLSRQ